jgi:signal transduction histidine kinase
MTVRLRLAVTYSIAVLATAMLVIAAVIAVADDPMRAALLGLVALLPTMTAIGLLVSDRAFRRAAHIEEAANQVDSGRDRIALAEPADEWKRLADTIDAMLDRIEDETEARWSTVQDLAHELRNPLAVMATTLDVALGDEDASVAELRRAAEVARRTVDRVAGTVDDLVIFARNEIPQSRRTEFDLAALLDEVVSEHRGPIEAQRLTVEGDETPTPVVADRDAVKRAIGNIVGNAVRLSHPGSSLRVGTGTHRGFAWVGVDDQGPGLDPRQHDQAFRRFWSRDAASLGGEGRAGLGLAITRQIAEQHGGIVTLRSELGAGAEFVIWMPLNGDAAVGKISADGVHPLWSPLLHGDEQVTVEPDTTPSDEATGSFIPA